MGKKAVPTTQIGRKVYDAMFLVGTETQHVSSRDTLKYVYTLQPGSSELPNTD